MKPRPSPLCSRCLLLTFITTSLCFLSTTTYSQEPSAQAGIINNQDDFHPGLPLRRTNDPTSDSLPSQNPNTDDEDGDGDEEDLTSLHFNPPRSFRLHNRSYKPLQSHHLDSLISLSSSASDLTASLKSQEGGGLSETSSSKPLFPTTDSILDFDPSQPQSKQSKRSLLTRLLVPRPPESSNLIELQDLITQHFASLSINGSWISTPDIFQMETPHKPSGQKTNFKNLIFTHDPTASRFLVLSAHLDSKWFPPNTPEGDSKTGFVGATDSAAPTAMIIDAVTMLNPWLEAKRKRKWELIRKGEWIEGGDEDESLKIVFFDGEEAFKQWTRTDSIYGARHLASLWSSPISTPSPTTPPQTHLSQISTLILLDLLGAPSPRIPSFYPRTEWLFDAFVEAERRLGEGGWLWKGVKGDGWKTDFGGDGGNGEVDGLAAAKGNGALGRSFFSKGGYGGAIEDDHIPFLHAGVPILHVITAPFPKVWHKITDDITALDPSTVKAWALITRLLLAEYLGLTPSENEIQSSKTTTKRIKNKKEIELDRGIEKGAGRLNGDL